jgi:hypothetical protein
MRNFLILAASAALAACGSGHAATMDAAQANAAETEAMSAASLVENDSSDHAVMNAAADPSYIAESERSSGHLPVNWAHQPGDILILEGGGFSFAQPGLHPYRFIDFRLPRDTVVRAVTIIRGRPSGSGRDLRCRGAPMDFTAFGALVLNFRHGRFVGWVLNPGARPLIETDLGLGIGTPRDQVGYGDEDLTSTRNTPLGPQFEINAIGGYLSSNRPNARVTRLYSGATCFARTPPDRPED